MGQMFRGVNVCLGVQLVGKDANGGIHRKGWGVELGRVDVRVVRDGRRPGGAGNGVAPSARAQLGYHIRHCCCRR